MDKATLQHVLNQLNGDISGLNATIAEKTNLLQQLTAEIERLTGARQYQQLVVTRISKDIATIVEAEKLEAEKQAAPATTTLPTPQ